MKLNLTKRTKKWNTISWTKALLLKEVDSFGKIVRIVPKKLTQNDNRNDFLFGT